MMPAPWSEERRAEMQARINTEAALAAAKIGAQQVVIIAFYPEGEHLHIMDGGSAPMTRSDLYTKLASMVQVVEEGHGDVRLN